MSANAEGFPEVDVVMERGRCSRCGRNEGRVLLLILEAAGGLSSAAELWLVLLYLAARDVSWTLVVGATGALAGGEAGQPPTLFTRHQPTNQPPTTIIQAVVVSARVHKPYLVSLLLRAKWRMKRYTTS